MINDQELLLVVDENNNPIAPRPRDEVHKKELWHRSCHVWIFNSKGQVLCQKRSLKKDIKPGFWESFFGGHVLAGQSEIESAIDELYEELSMRVKKNDLIFFKIFKDSSEDTAQGFVHKTFKYVFWIKKDKDLRDFKLEEEEMDEIKWMDFEKVKKLLLGGTKDWVTLGYYDEFFAWLKKILSKNV